MPVPVCFLASSARAASLTGRGGAPEEERKEGDAVAARDLADQPVNCGGLAIDTARHSGDKHVV